MSTEGFLRLDSNYAYVLGELERHLLQVEAEVLNNEFTQDHLEIMAKDMEETAKTLAKNQGVYDYYKYDGGDHLVDSIHAEPTYNGITMSAPIRDKRGKYYAGHQEYGFHPRGGKTFIPARPFMRPALRIVAAKTRDNMTDLMAELLTTRHAVGEGLHGDKLLLPISTRGFTYRDGPLRWSKRSVAIDESVHRISRNPRNRTTLRMNFSAEKPEYHGDWNHFAKGNGMTTWDREGKRL